jgi:DNA-binding ferritin-like protein
MSDNALEVLDDQKDYDVMAQKHLDEVAEAINRVGNEAVSAIESVRVTSRNTAFIEAATECMQLALENKDDAKLKYVYLDMAQRIMKLK